MFIIFIVNALAYWGSTLVVSCLDKKPFSKH